MFENFGIFLIFCENFENSVIFNIFVFCKVWRQNVTFRYKATHLVNASFWPNDIRFRSRLATILVRSCCWTRSILKLASKQKRQKFSGKILNFYIKISYFHIKLQFLIRNFRFFIQNFSLFVPKFVTLA